MNPDRNKTNRLAGTAFKTEGLFTTGAAPRSSTAKFGRSRQLLLLLGVQGLLVCITLFYALDLGRKDLSVPFTFYGDTMLGLANVTAILVTGWYWWNPLLSAPFTFPLIAFPANTSVDSVVVWAVACFNSNPGFVLNVSWLLFFIISATLAFYCLRQVHVETVASMLFGTIYAFIPFVFYRSTAHFQLNVYLVPFACTMAISIASGRHLKGSRRAVLLIGCALLGFNYVYNAIFAILVILAAFGLAFLHRRAASQWRIALVSVAVIGATTALNLAPSVYFWHIHGKPFGQYKSVGDSETYGLKIRHLLSPVPGRTSRPIRWWLARETASSFPLENENQSARLGIVPAAGFLLLLVTVFRSRNSGSFGGRELRAAADLNLIMLLIGTIGGFGALISLLVSPDIRCYNRISVFLAFFSLVGLGLTLPRLLRRFGRPASTVILVLITFLALYDQTAPATKIVELYEGDATSAKVTANVVGRIEKQLCADCMVFQLPETTFPPDSVRNRMLPYDHARPHLYSKTLRWSWPPFAVDRKDWGESLPSIPAKLVTSLTMAGFRLVWLDRWGYTSSADSPEPGLVEELGPPSLESTDHRIAIFDLRRRGGSSGSGAAQRGDALHVQSLMWGPGFYDREITANGVPFRWSQARSSLTIHNREQRAQDATFRAVLQAPTSHVQNLTIRIGDRTIVHRIDAHGREIAIPLHLEPGGVAELSFEYDGKKLDASPDPRQLYFFVLRPEIEF